MATTSLIEVEWVAVEPPGPGAAPRFLLSKFPVTVEQFQGFLDAGGYGERAFWSERGWAWKERTGFTAPAYWGEPGYERPRLPVTGISFWEAEACARFAGARLPTEGEWSLAASNHGATRYPWGDEPGDAAGPRRANLNFFGALAPPGRVEVDSFPEGRSRAGVWDLLGNVSEWCLPGDRHDLDPGRRGGVLRGGCSWHTPLAVDATFRDEVGLETRDNQTGIRLLRPLQAGRRAAVPPVVPRPTEPAAPPPRRTRPIARPTRPFRQEGIPERLDAGTWRLEVGGEVERPLALSLADLKAGFPRVTARGLFVCVCRWGQVNEFAGVRLRELVARARPTRDPAELYLLQRSVPGPGGRVYESSIALGEALAEDALLAWEMDGRELTPEVGWPLRLVAWHLYGYKTVKCLAELVLARDFRAGWWEEECQYDPRGLVQPGRITVVGERPYALQLDRPGRVALAADELSAVGGRA